MFALFLTAFLACSSETKETTTTENKTLKIEMKDGKATNSEFVDTKSNSKTKTLNTSGTSNTTTSPTTGQNVEKKKSE